ncbi:hypothetical protein M9458_020261, partial [Cirrhinus mrigala]
YYYDGDMISKVQGKRFVYKFVCDLRTLIGYSAAELNSLVTECEQKKLARVQLHGLGQPVNTVTLATATGQPVTTRKTVEEGVACHSQPIRRQV